MLVTGFIIRVMAEREIVYFYYINKSCSYNQKIDWKAPVLYRWINTCLIQIYGIDLVALNIMVFPARWASLKSSDSKYFPNSTPFTVSMFFAINGNI